MTAPRPTAPTINACFSRVASRIARSPARPIATRVPGWIFAFCAPTILVMIPARSHSDSRDDSGLLERSRRGRTDPAHDLALQSVLDRFSGGMAEHPDVPDGWV